VTHCESKHVAILNLLFIYIVAIDLHFVAFMFRIIMQPITHYCIQETSQIVAALERTLRQSHGTIDGRAVNVPAPSNEVARLPVSVVHDLRLHVSSLTVYTFFSVKTTVSTTVHKINTWPKADGAVSHLAFTVAPD
jgi:hypothetical protein